MLFGFFTYLPLKWQMTLSAPITRCLLATVTALVITLATGPFWIRWLKSFRVGQVVRDDGPQSHLQKTGTPTMGGIMMLVAIFISVGLWSRWTQVTWCIALVTLLFALIGMWDDLQKLVFKSSKGLRGRWKYLAQSVIAIITMLWLYRFLGHHHGTDLVIPFYDALMPLGVFIVVLGYFVIVGTSNAVNLTDGLDGLAILPIVLVAFGLGAMAYLSSHAPFAAYFHMPYIKDAGEVAVFCSAIIGAGLGFLWFNANPAEVFMGDIGSLSLGAALGVMAMLIRQELTLFIIGGVFVIEAVSVILQVGSYKLRRKRIFKMAPIHHHFELKGWSETQVVVRFWLLAAILVMIGLSALKFR